MDQARVLRRAAVVACLGVAATMTSYVVRGGDADTAKKKTPSRVPQTSASRSEPLPYDPLRPELNPDALERGEANEPDIAHLEEDWTRGVEVRATIERRELRQSQRVHLIVEVKNVSGKPCWFPPQAFNRYLGTRIRVFDTKGNLVPMTEYYKKEARSLPISGGNSAGGYAFNPGDVTCGELIPNLIYDMTLPGEYWVLAEVPFGAGSLGPGPEGVILAKAKPIKVKVLHEIEVIGKRGITILDPDRP